MRPDAPSSFNPNPFNSLLDLFKKDASGSQKKTSETALIIIKEMHALTEKQSSFFSCCSSNNPSVEEKKRIVIKLTPKLQELWALIQEIGDAEEIGLIQEAFDKYKRQRASFFGDSETALNHSAFSTTITIDESDWEKQINLQQERLSATLVMYQALLTSNPRLKENTFKRCHMEVNKALNQANSLKEFDQSMTPLLEAYSPLLTTEQLFHVEIERLLQFTVTLAKTKKKFSEALLVQKVWKKLPPYAKQYYDTLMNTDRSTEERLKTIVSLCEVGGTSPVMPIAHLITIEKIPLRDLTSLELDESIISEALAESQHFDVSGYQNNDLCMQRAIEICGKKSGGLKQIQLNGSNEHTVGLIVDLDRITAYPLDVLSEVESCLRRDQTFPRIYLLKSGVLAEITHDPRGSENEFIITLLKALFKTNQINHTRSLHAIVGPHIFPSMPQAFSIRPTTREQLIIKEKFSSEFKSFGTLLAACHKLGVNVGETHLFDSLFFRVLGLEHAEKFTDIVLPQRRFSGTSSIEVPILSIENQLILAWLIINQYPQEIMDLFSSDTLNRLSLETKNSLINQLTAILNMLGHSDALDIGSRMTSVYPRLHRYHDMEMHRSHLLSTAKTDSRLIATSIIAKETSDFLGGMDWFNFQATLEL